MDEVSELKHKIDYLEDTIACMKGENTALKAKLAEISTIKNNKKTKDEPCPFCVGRIGRICSTCEDCLGSGKRLFTQ